MRKGYTAFWLIIILLIFSFPAGADFPSDKELKLYARRDVIKEVRGAAAKALMIRYKRDKKTVEDWKELLYSSSLNEAFKNQAVSYLAEAYRRKTPPNSFSEAEQRAKSLEEIIAGEKNKYVKKAASRALGDFYGVFCLYKKKDYTVEDMKSILNKPGGEWLNRAASQALTFVFAQRKTPSELEDAYKSSEKKYLKEILSSAYALRLSSPLHPKVKATKLKKMTENDNNPSWIRRAAGKAYGYKAESVPEKKLTEYAMSRKNPYLRRGAGDALSRSISSSDFTVNELLRMIVSAANYEPKPYRKALENALAVKWGYSNS